MSDDLCDVDEQDDLPHKDNNSINAYHLKPSIISERMYSFKKSNSSKDERLCPPSLKNQH